MSRPVEPPVKARAIYFMTRSNKFQLFILLF